MILLGYGLANGFVEILEAGNRFVGLVADLSDRAFDDRDREFLIDPFLGLAGVCADPVGLKIADATDPAKGIAKGDLIPIFGVGFSRAVCLYSASYTNRLLGVGVGATVWLVART